jgi:hypothetical protein
MGFGAFILGLTGLQADVDAFNNLKVNLPATLTQAGYAIIAGQIPGSPNQNRIVNVSAEGRPHVALDRPIFYMNFAGSATSANAIPQDALKQTATTMTAAAGSPSNGFLLLNASAINTTATGIQYQTYATFATYAGFGTRYEFEAATVNAGSAANKTIELGSFLTTDAKTPGILDGFCFRWNASGEFRGIMSINGTETSTAPLAIPSDNVIHRYTIVVNQGGLDFLVDGLWVATLAVPTDQVGPGFQPNLPQAVRVYNSVATPTLAPQLKVAEMWVTQCGVDWNKPWAHIKAGEGQHCSNVPFGTAIGETTNGGNAVAIPATAVGSNTAALLNALGGTARMTAQVTNVAAAGDNIFCSYQVPVQSATQGSKRLVITGVRIAASNGGAVIATTPTQLLWGLAWGHTAVSLATADAVGAKAPRHMKLGQMYGAIGNVIGQGYDRDLVAQFSTPIVVNPGEFIAVTLRFLLGTATALQEVVGCVGFEGYWE